MDVVWSKKAVLRIHEIWDYYKTKSKKVALKLINDIEDETDITGYGPSGIVHRLYDLKNDPQELKFL